MKNPLHNELEDLRYFSISSIDPYDIPESVVIYFKNNSEVNKKMSIETIHGTQLDLQNQNPTIVLENDKAKFCLGSEGYIPTVTINPVEDYIDPVYPLSITFTGTISRTESFIPNSILVEYEGVSSRASLIDDTNWSITFPLNEVVENTLQRVSVIANSLDVNNPDQEGAYSNPVRTSFNILITEIEASVDLINCICIDPSKSYMIKVEDESFSGPFLEGVEFLDQRGIYAYPSKRLCAPCENPIPYLVFQNKNPYGPYQNTFQKHKIDLYLDDEFIKTIEFDKTLTDTYAVIETFRQIPGISIRSIGSDDTSSSITNLEIHNTTEDYLQIRLEVSKEVLAEFKKAEYASSTPYKLELSSNVYTISLCLEPSPVMACTDSIVSEVSLYNNLYFYFQNDYRVVINGMDMTENYSRYLYLYASGYGINIGNLTSDCLDVQIYLNTSHPEAELYLASMSSPFGFVETFDDHIRVVLSGVQPTVPEILFSVRPSNGYYLIDENRFSKYSTKHTLEVELRTDSGRGFLAEPFSATVTINGEVFHLDEEVVTIGFVEVDTPLTSSLESEIYSFDVSIQSDQEYNTSGLYDYYIIPFDNNLRPSTAGRISVLEMENSQWTSLVGEEDYYEPNSTYKTSPVLIDVPRQGTALIELDPIFVGLKIKFKDNIYTITESTLSIPYYHDTYYDDGHPNNSANIYFVIENSIGDTVAMIELSTIRHYISIYDTERATSNSTGFSYLQVNTPYTFSVHGFSLSVTGVKLEWGNIGSNTPPLGAAFFEEGVTYPVQNEFATLPPKTLTVTYSPYVSGGFTPNYIVATITEATDPDLIGQKVTTYYNILWYIT